MKDLNFFSKIYVATFPVDFRKQIRGLSAIVQETMEMNPLTERYLFVFSNRKNDSIRLLYWDQTGFALWSKTLEKDTYRWPKNVEEGQSLITAKELKWLLQGVDISKIKTHEKLNFAAIF